MATSITTIGDLIKAGKLDPETWKKVAEETHIDPGRCVNIPVHRHINIFLHNKTTLFKLFLAKYELYPEQEHFETILRTLIENCEHPETKPTGKPPITLYSLMKDKRLDLKVWMTIKKDFVWWSDSRDDIDIFTDINKITLKYRNKKFGIGLIAFLFLMCDERSHEPEIEAVIQMLQVLINSDVAANPHPSNSKSEASPIVTLYSLIKDKKLDLRVWLHVNESFLHRVRIDIFANINAPIVVDDLVGNLLVILMIENRRQQKDLTKHDNTNQQQQIDAAKLETVIRVLLENGADPNPCDNPTFRRFCKKNNHIFNAITFVHPNNFQHLMKLGPSFELSYPLNITLIHFLIDVSGLGLTLNLMQETNLKDFQSVVQYLEASPTQDELFDLFGPGLDHKSRASVFFQAAQYCHSQTTMTAQFPAILTAIHGGMQDGVSSGEHSSVPRDIVTVIGEYIKLVPQDYYPFDPKLSPNPDLNSDIQQSLMSVSPAQRQQRWKTFLAIGALVPPQPEPKAENDSKVDAEVHQVDQHTNNSSSSVSLSNTYIPSYQNGTAKSINSSSLSSQPKDSSIIEGPLRSNADDTSSGFSDVDTVRPPDFPREDILIPPASFSTNGETEALGRSILAELGSMTPGEADATQAAILASIDHPQPLSTEALDYALQAEDTLPAPAALSSSSQETSAFNAILTSVRSDPHVRRRDLSSAKFKELCLALSENTRLRELRLSGCDIQAEDAQILASALVFDLAKVVPKQDSDDEAEKNSAEFLGPDHSDLVHLDFSNNDFGDDGIQALAHVLTLNHGVQGLVLNNLVYLDVSNNNFGLEGAKAIAKVLFLNSLEYLDISGNNFGPEAAKVIAEALSSNRSLQSFNAARCGMGDVGASHFAQALKVHPRLQYCNLSDNDIRVEGAKSLGQALEVNHSLQNCQLYRNAMADEGARYLAAALRTNHVLQTLAIDFNDIGEAGLEAFSQAIAVDEHGNGGNRTLMTLSMDDNASRRLYKTIRDKLAQNTPQNTADLEQQEEQQNSVTEQERQVPRVSAESRSVSSTIMGLSTEGSLTGSSQTSSNISVKSLTQMEGDDSSQPPASPASETRLGQPSTEAVMLSASCLAQSVSSSSNSPVELPEGLHLQEKDEKIASEKLQQDLQAVQTVLAKAKPIPGLERPQHLRLTAYQKTKNNTSWANSHYQRKVGQGYSPESLPKKSR